MLRKIRDARDYKEARYYAEHYLEEAAREARYLHPKWFCEIERAVEKELRHWAMRNASISPQNLYQQQIDAYQNAMRQAPSPLQNQNWPYPFPDQLPEPKVSLKSETTWGEIIALRVWKFENQFLTSVYKPMDWIPGETVRAHKKPSDYGQEGLHGWKSVFEAAEYIKQYQQENWCSAPKQQFNARISYVFGRIALWGEVVEHARGYRAEFAKILSIDDAISNDGKHNAELLQKLNEQYFPKDKKIAK